MKVFPRLRKRRKTKDDDTGHGSSCTGKITNATSGKCDISTEDNVHDAQAISDASSSVNTIHDAHWKDSKSRGKDHGITAKDYVYGARVMLNAVADSADAFGPLKSAASAVRVIIDLSQKVNDNRDDANEIAQRAERILTELQKFPDTSTTRLNILDDFLTKLQDVQRSVEDIHGSGRFKRILNSSQHARRLREIQTRMQNMESDILFISNQALRYELNKMQTTLNSYQIQLKELSHLDTKILAYAQTNLILISFGLF